MLGFIKRIAFSKLRNAIIRLLCYAEAAFRTEIKRRQLAEAAEKRQMEASSRGIKNIYSVEQKKKKQEEIEKRMAASGPGGEGGLRWQVG
uniref:Small VCP interacting protein n=1 Tax=Gallus gallus TaxID=9031 RepID=A0A8V0ZRX0_CHICK